MCFLLRAALCSFVVSRCATTTVQDGACPAQTGSDDVNLELRSGGSSLLQARIIGEANATSNVSTAQPWIAPPPELEPWTQPSQPGVVSQLDPLVVVEPPIKRFHVLSIGRQGSCFIAKLLARRRAGPFLFEPLGGLEGKHFEGATTLSRDQTAGRHVRCMYDCHTCTALDVNMRCYHILQNYCSQTDRTGQQMLIKTIRVIDLTALRDVPRPQLLETRFVVLLRDPRGVWSSTKHWVEWAMHSFHHVCKALMLQAFSLPELASIVGPERIMVAIFEQWSMGTESFAKYLADFVRATPDEAKKMVSFAKSRQKPIEDLDPPRWARGTTEQTLTPEELADIEGNKHCAAYMDRLGYRTGRPEGFDYSRLRSSSDLFTDLLPSQAALLSELRASVRQLTSLVTTQAQDDGGQTDSAKLVFDPSGAAALAESVEG